MIPTHWGTPEPEPVHTVGVHPQVEDAPVPVPVEDAVTAYVVVVEQSVGTGNTIAWGVEPNPTPLPVGTTREEAREIALATARRLEPQHPWNKISRRVLRLTPDSYLVLVQGSTRLFPFRVTVAETVPDA